MALKWIRTRSREKALELVPEDFEVIERRLRRFGRSDKHFYWKAKEKEFERLERIGDEKISGLDVFHSLDKNDYLTLDTSVEETEFLVGDESIFGRIVRRENNLETVETFSIETGGGNVPFIAESTIISIVKNLNRTELDLHEEDIQSTIKDFIFDRFDATKGKGEKLSDKIRKIGIEYSPTSDRASERVRTIVEMKGKKRAIFDEEIII